MRLTAAATEPDSDVTVAADLTVEFEAAGMPGRAEIESWLQATVEAAGRGAPGGIEVGVRIVSESESRQLNRQYRGTDRATNVLAFPAVPIPAGWPRGVSAPLGDLVICAPVVMREAAEQGKDVSAHWAHMLVHGMLHLLGYDHMADDAAERMEALEIKVLAAGGLENPYEDRYST